jgi:hypothetical protein
MSRADQRVVFPCMVAGMPTVPERLTAFLVKSKGAAFCDDCLRMRLSLARRQQAQQATSALGVTDQFERRLLRCVECGAHKMGTVAV